MSRAGELSWLCRLIDESLRAYTEPEVVTSICKEKEKEILVASSQVLRKIQLRIRGFDSQAEDAAAKHASNKEDLCGSNHECLPTIVARMMILLAVKSQFVQHLAVNVLALTSQFVSTMGNNWDGFIRLLCHFWEMGIARMLSYSSPSSSGAENRNFDLSEVGFPMHYGIKNGDSSIVAGTCQLLRVICKYLKEDPDDQLIKVYYDSVNSCLLKVPWDLLDGYQICNIGGTEQSASMNQLYVNNFSAMDPEIEFLGSFLQLLCSLADRNDSDETGCESANKRSLLATAISLIPRLVNWCLGKQENIAETCIIHYFKHKLLILMIRLGSLTYLGCSIRLSWLDLLRNHFQELLQQPLTPLQSDQDDCLEGSPFLLSLADTETCAMHSSHLQRQAVFIFLDCSFSLICQIRENAEHCNCSNLCSCFTTDLDSKLDHCCRQKALVELYKWIQGHLPTEISVHHEKYLEICMNFMSSFLQLYIREDDLLFEVLLKLLSITSCLQQKFGLKEAKYPYVMMEDFPFHLSEIFNPVHLFHLFLSEIHYDHQVLLDYLISKDTGISCAKYLLRCLRLICDKWQLFVEFPVFGDLLFQSSFKKRKVLRDGLDCLADGMPSSIYNKGSIKFHIKNYKEDSECGCTHCNIGPFKNAAECLLSLKNSVENLHQKKLFPYNPEVLLKRLKRFQEFCCAFDEKDAMDIKISNYQNSA